MKGGQRFKLLIKSDRGSFAFESFVVLVDIRGWCLFSHYRQNKVELKYKALS